MKLKPVILAFTEQDLKAKPVSVYSNILAGYPKSLRGTEMQALIVEPSTWGSLITKDSSFNNLLSYQFVGPLARGHAVVSGFSLEPIPMLIRAACINKFAQHPDDVLWLVQYIEWFQDPDILFPSKDLDMSIFQYVRVQDKDQYDEYLAFKDANWDGCELNLNDCTCQKDGYRFHSQLTLAEVDPFNPPKIEDHIKTIVVSGVGSFDPYQFNNYLEAQRERLF